MPDPDQLRARLVALRRGALAQLAKSDRLDAEALELIAHTGDALAAIDAEAGALAEPGDRAVVMDDNTQLTIAVYAADRQAACATVSPTAAIRLGNQLVAAGAVAATGPPLACIDAPECN